MEKEIELIYLLKYFCKRKTPTILITMGFFILANIIFYMNGFLYSNTGKVKISNNATDNRLASYKDYLLSDYVIEPAIIKSNINVDANDIKSNLSINANIGSSIYTITLNYSDKENGKQLCEAIISEYINHLHIYDESDAVLYDKVVTSNLPVNFVKNELMFIVVGSVLSLGYTLGFLYFDNSIKSENELDRYNVLGSINNNVNLVKTKIKLCNLGKVILLNAIGDINCKNDIYKLVKELSKESKVILVDTNIRNNKTKALGYSDLLNNGVENVLKYINHKNGFDLLEKGSNKKETDRLLLSKNNKKLISNLKHKYDYVFLYNTSTTDYSDSLVLSRLCNRNYLIVEINKTDSRDLKKMIDSYQQINSNVDGIIIINE